MPPLILAVHIRLNMSCHTSALPKDVHERNILFYRLSLSTFLSLFSFRVLSFLSFGLYLLATVFWRHFHQNFIHRYEGDGSNSSFRQIYFHLPRKVVNANYER